MANPQLNPSKITEVGLGFWASKTLLSAVELDIFTHLGNGKKTAAELADATQMHERGKYDFLDSLVALGFLGREGVNSEAKYFNTPETGAFLNKTDPRYMGGILEMANNRLYSSWGGLTEGLKTGKPQNELKNSDKDIWEELYSDPKRLEEFALAMAGIQAGNFQALVEKFDFSKYETLCDVGGSTGKLCIMAAQRHPHLRCISFDLPAIEPVAKKYIAKAGVANRVEVANGSFLNGGMPEADVICMGNILHDWNLEMKKSLIKKAFDSVSPGGAFIAIENIIDDERRKNVFGLLMSLNMLIEFGENGFDYTGEQFNEWCLEAGFERTEIMPLTGPSSAAVAYKR